MNLYLIICGIILFVAVIVYLIYTTIKSESTEMSSPVIHASGIYSVVRRSPRGSIHPAKPKIEDIRDYLDNINKDDCGNVLSASDKEKLIKDWEDRLDRNISIIEDGDKNGLEIYFYKQVSKCKKNESMLGQNKFITREEIYQHPELIPPLHLGCKCELVPDTEFRKGGHLNNATSPLTEESGFFPIDWKLVDRGNCSDSVGE